VSNRRKPRNPGLAIPRVPNVVDVAWAEHRRKVLAAEFEKKQDNFDWMRKNYHRLMDS